MKPRLWAIGLLATVLISACSRVQSKCSGGCDLALASYYVQQSTTLSFISQVLSASVADIVSYNKDKISNPNSVQTGIRINVPFSCGCINDSFLGHEFSYTVIQGDTYGLVATEYYSNLTTVGWLQAFNSYPATNITVNSVLKVVVNCSCGNSIVSKDYGLFITYPLRPEDTLQSVATEVNLTAELLQRYNPGVNFSQGSGLVYIPGKGEFFFFLILLP